MRKASPVHLGFVLLLAVAAPGAEDTPLPNHSPAGPPPLTGGCEPAPDLDLGVRLLELTRGEKTASAQVRLTLMSLRELAEVRLAGGPAGRGVEMLPSGFDMPALPSGLPSRAVRHMTVTVSLEEGREHHLLFTAEGLDAGGDRHATSASLRIDLDPARAPRLLDGLVEYRARVQP